MKMTHKQRIENTLQLKETDRTPYSMWWHVPNRDRHPRRLAELTMQYQRKYDLDFIKFMPYGMYSAIDYGIDLDLFPGFVDAPVAHKPFVEKVEDWDKIHFVRGTEGEYAIVLEAQRLLFSMMDERIPFVNTVFSPMTTAAKLSAPKLLAEHIKQDPARVRRALEIITETTAQFARATVAAGADGLFFASQFSTSDLLDMPTHEEFVRKYDMPILDAVKDRTWFNILHLHGANTYIRELQDYPVQAFSWHDRDDGPSMEEVRKFSDKTFIGGLSWGKNWLTKSNEEVRAEVVEVAARNGGRGVILGPGCVIDPSTPEERLELVHKTVLETAKK